jgi:16S rRNA (guanine966-N2)-methyltransferase
MAQQKRGTGQVRIIGGKFRGRKLLFDGDASLRPTLGRTRETLFNWLRGYTHHCVCLDAFAGSGALGFEALSQGAASVHFVEQNPRTLHTLQATSEALSVESSCTFEAGDAINYLKRAHLPVFDVVFLDPPFDQSGLLGDALSLLASKNLVRHFVYAEAQQLTLLETASANAGFAITKQTQSGDSAAVLLTPHTDIAACQSQG